jgi:hypothetical protein
VSYRLLVERISDRYEVMSTDELLRVAADPKSLTWLAHLYVFEVVTKLLAEKRYRWQDAVLSQGGGAKGVQMADWLGTIRAYYSYTGGGYSQSGAHAPFGETYGLN